MRKFLLLLSILSAGAFSAVAQDVVREVTPKTTNTTSSNMTSVTAYNKTLTLTGDDGSKYSVYGFNNNNFQWTTDPMRTGNKNASTIGTATIKTDEAISAKVSKIEVNVKRIKAGINDKLGSNGIKVLVSGDGTFSNETPSFAFDLTDFPTAINGTAVLSANITDAPANAYYRIAFDMAQTATNNGWLAVNTIKYYGEKEVGAVDAPSISVNDDSKVVISAVDGASVYYTVNGDTPTTSSTLYTAPFAITAKTTVKAIAVLNGKNSSVTTFEAVPSIVNSIPAFITLAPTTPVKINAGLTVIYHNGRNLYLTDGNDNFILAYNNDNITIPALTNGKVLSSITGTYKSQNGLHELIPSAIGEISDGDEIEPEELAIEEIGTDMLNKYVAIPSVSIAAQTKANNYTATDDSGSITVYNTFYNSAYYNPVVTVPEGDGFTMNGFVSCYNATLQITPISFTGGDAKEHVADPVFNPESGTKLNIGDEISITTTTEGATLHYTLDESVPTEDSEVLNNNYIYTGGPLTIKVLAVKDGMLPSNVVTATYTELVEGEETVSFDFSSDGNIKAKLDEMSSNTEIASGNESSENGTNNISGVEFVNGPVKLTITKAGGTTSPKWWSTSDANAHLRIYKNNIVDVRITQDNFRLTKVVATQGTTVSNSNFGNVNFPTVVTNLTPEAEAEAMSRAADTDGTWDDETKTWTAPENDFVVWLKMTVNPESNSQLGGFEASYILAPGATAGIDGVNIDNSNAPVEYYNLQGVKISTSNLTPGIYIRRQGTQVMKVLVK